MLLIGFQKPILHTLHISSTLLSKSNKKRNPQEKLKLKIWRERVLSVQFWLRYKIVIAVTISRKRRNRKWKEALIFSSSFLSCFLFLLENSITLHLSTKTGHKNQKIRQVQRGIYSTVHLTTRLRRCENWTGAAGA